MGVLNIGLLAAQAATANSTSVWILVAIALLGSSVLAGLITSVLGNLRAPRPPGGRGMPMPSDH